jgi:hypothetical protein
MNLWNFICGGSGRTVGLRDDVYIRYSGRLHWQWEQSATEWGIAEESGQFLSLRRFSLAINRTLDHIYGN